MRIARSILTACTIVAAAHAQQIGSVDGQPILKPKQTDTAHVCANIKAQIEHVARESQKHQFGIVATDDDLKLAAQNYWKEHDAAAELAQQQKTWNTLNLAAAQVLDNHQDAHTVYMNLIAPSRLPENLWQKDLALWSQPEGRAKLQKQAAFYDSMTVNAYKQAFDSAARQIVEKQKLDAAVDTQLAAGDPTFREYLQEEQQHKPMLDGHMQYVEQKRNDFWQARYAQQQVTLNDPSLAQQCQIGTNVARK